MLFSLAALALGLSTAGAAESLDPGDGAAIAAHEDARGHDSRRDRGPSRSAPAARPAPSRGSAPTASAPRAPSAPRAYTPAPSAPRAYAPAPSAPRAYAPAPSAPRAYAPAPSAPRAYAPTSAPSAPRAYGPAPSAPRAYAPPARPGAPSASAPRGYGPSAPAASAPRGYGPPPSASAPRAPGPYAAARPPVPGSRASGPAVTPSRIAPSAARSVVQPSRPPAVRSDAVRPAHPPSAYRPPTRPAQPSYAQRPGRGPGHARPSHGYGHYHPGWYRPHFYQPVVVERYYSAYNYPIRPWSGVFVYGPPPVYHNTYVVQQADRGQRVEVEKEHLPDRRIDRKDTFAVGVRGGSFIGGYDHAAPYADPGLGLTVRYRPEEAIGLELGVTHFDPSWKEGSTRSQTFGQASLELFAFPWARVSPYVLGGVTYGKRRFADDIADDLTGQQGTIVQRDGNWGPHVGVGVEFALGKTVGLDFDARYQALVTAGPQDPTLPIGLQANAGVMIHF